VYEKVFIGGEEGKEETEYYREQLPAAPLEEETPGIKARKHSSFNGRNQRSKEEQLEKDSFHAASRS